MGFSVSGSAAIVFVGMFIAFGMFYSASSNSMEQITDARSAWQEDVLTQQNTAIEVTNVTRKYNLTGNELYYVNVTVDNTGATDLAVDNTDVLVDNTYQTSFSNRAVEGDNTTNLWLPGETLVVNMTFSSSPSRVKVVTGPGVAATEVVA